MSTAKLRLIVARYEGDARAFPVAAISEDTWEIIPPEDWDKLRRELSAKMLGDREWTAYDYAECVVTIPQAAIDALFQAGQIVGSVAASGDSDPS